MTSWPATSAVPLSGVVLALGFLLLLVGGLATPAAGLVGDLAWLAAHALLRSADPVGAWPWLDIRLPSPPLWAGWLFVLGLGLLAAQKPRAWLVVLLGAWGVLGRPPDPADGRLHLTVLDVGQGGTLTLSTDRGEILAEKWDRSAVKVVVERDGKRFAVNAVLGERP